MAVEQVRQAVIDTLPTSGEVDYQEFVGQLHAAGHHEAPELLLRFKHEGAIKMRLDITNPTSPVLLVSRSGEGG